ncbi:MAG: Gx transporter family protein [Clostridia bacterium]|nr:Gx transporter family protein [Clostridia bacterium]
MSAANGAPLARRLTLPAVLVSLALLLSLLERMLAIDALTPVPGLRLGLPNIVTLFALWALGRRPALAVLVLRCLLGALFGGRLSSLAFSLGGGLTAFAVMALLLPLEGEEFSVVGVSIAGAAAHNAGQLLAARVVMGTPAVFAWFPFLLLGSLGTGTITGLLFSWLRPNLLRVPAIRAVVAESDGGRTAQRSP